MSMISYFRIPPPLVCAAPEGAGVDPHGSSPPRRARPARSPASDPAGLTRLRGVHSPKQPCTRPKEARAMSVTVRDLRAFKERGERFVMLTAYDYPTARILDEAGIPVILVGDSVGNNVLGYETTVPVTMEEMLHHCRAVARAVKKAMVVGDMPFMSFHTTIGDGVRNAGRFLKEGG